MHIHDWISIDFINFYCLKLNVFLHIFFALIIIIIEIFHFIKPFNLLISSIFKLLLN
jgi:hypothetical protein